MDFWWVVAALSAAATADSDRWTAELARLDLQRARAFAMADPALLSEVYADSATAADDAAVIADYARYRARVVGASMSYLDVRLQRDSGNAVELLVVDQLNRSRVVWKDGTSRWLPRDRATKRLIILTRTKTGYRISESRLR